MTKTYRLTTIEHAVQIGTGLPLSWFRGHGTVVGELAPRIFRQDLYDEVLRAARPSLELEMIEAFKTDAPAIAQSPVPDEANRLGWLYLMQHYRAPTRLLDWTENPLAALFFTVSDSQHRDGELWALYPQALNNAGEVGRALPIIGLNPVLKYLVDEPYWAGKPEDLAAQHNIPVVPRCPAAFLPRHNFLRMTVQSSVFTIHPAPRARFTIAELLPDERHLVRYIVPASVKPVLMRDLRALGMTERTLFPDFEGLSSHILADAWTIAYTPPDPPVCGGDHKQ